MRADVRLRLGASAGVSVFPHDGHTCEALLDVADRRMYRDKASRNVYAAPSKAQRIDRTIRPVAGDFVESVYAEATLAR